VKIEKLVFFIPSVTYFKDAPFCYMYRGRPVDAPRSVFSPEERAAHTLKTIKSIRRYVPEAKIALVEVGRKYQLPFSLNDLVDKYIYLGKNPLVRLACDSKYKGLGEAVCLIAARKHLKNLADFYFNMGSRRYLNNNFNLDDWKDHDGFIIKNDGRRKDVNFPHSMSTNLYGFSNKFFPKWQYALWRCIPSLLIPRAIEKVLPRHLPQDSVKIIDKLGVAGNFGSTGVYLEE